MYTQISTAIVPYTAPMTSEQFIRTEVIKGIMNGTIDPDIFTLVDRIRKNYLSEYCDIQDPQAVFKELDNLERYRKRLKSESMPFEINFAALRLNQNIYPTPMDIEEDFSDEQPFERTCEWQTDKIQSLVQRSLTKNQKPNDESIRTPMPVIQLTTLNDVSEKIHRIAENFINELAEYN